ncbi:MAG: hypothetical protein ABSB34_12245 [Candidatus Limnocylindrales bacterium]
MRPSSHRTTLAGLAVGLVFIAAACSSAAATPAPGAASLMVGSTNNPTLGAYLTGQNGMTLYVLTTDTPDTSTCTGSCATTWPPLSVAAGAPITGPTGATLAFGTMTRADGTVQVTYYHMPLYYYSGDSVAGDTTGEGRNNTWFVAPLSGSVGSPAASPAPTTSSGYGY